MVKKIRYSPSSLCFLPSWSNHGLLFSVAGRKTRWPCFWSRLRFLYCIWVFFASWAVRWIIRYFDFGQCNTLPLPNSSQYCRPVSKFQFSCHRFYHLKKQCGNGSTAFCYCSCVGERQVSPLRLHWILPLTTRYLPASVIGLRTIMVCMCSL